MNALCGAVSEQCVPAVCTTMCYPGCSKAVWVDERGKRHHFAAPRYIDCVMSYCEAIRNNEGIYPTKYGKWRLLPPPVQARPSPPTSSSTAGG